jgi:hypothetical protein
MLGRVGNVEGLLQVIGRPLLAKLEVLVQRIDGVLRLLHLPLEYLVGILEQLLLVGGGEHRELIRVALLHRRQQERAVGTNRIDEV